MLRSGASMSRLKRPTSVSDLAFGHLLTRKQAWQSPAADDAATPKARTKAPRLPSPRAGSAMMAGMEELTPVAQHWRTTEPAAETPSAANFLTAHSNRTSANHDPPPPVALDASFAHAAGELAQPKLAAPKGFALPKLNLAAPMADPRGATLVTAHVGSTRRLLGPTATEAAAAAPPPLALALHLALDVGSSQGGGGGVDDLFDDMLEGVEGVVEVDDDAHEGSVGGSFATPRRSRRPMALAIDAGCAAGEGGAGRGLGEGWGRGHAESYLFTQSGAINLDGVALPIRDTGMVHSSLHGAPLATDPARHSHGPRGATEEEKGEEELPGGKSAAGKLPLGVRVVRLERLGAGAAGVVYKGFDLVRPLPLQPLPLPLQPLPHEPALPLSQERSLSLLYSRMFSQFPVPVLSRALPDDLGAGGAQGDPHLRPKQATADGARAQQPLHKPPRRAPPPRRRADRRRALGGRKVPRRRRSRQLWGRRQGRRQGGARRGHGGGSGAGGGSGQSRRALQRGGLQRRLQVPRGPLESSGG